MLEGAWGTMAIVGVVVLGAAIAWAMFRNKEDETPEIEAASERGSHDLYDAESAKEMAEERREASLGRQPGGPDPRLDDGTAPGQDVRRD